MPKQELIKTANELISKINDKVINNLKKEDIEVLEKQLSQVVKDLYEIDKVILPNKFIHKYKFDPNNIDSYKDIYTLNELIKFIEDPIYLQKEILTEILEEKYKKVLDLIHTGKLDLSNSENASLWTEMVDVAFDLSKIVHPKHHEYMLRNRGVPENTREFYNHIHPIQDLLKFVYDPKANDDPEDKTIDNEFKISIFSRRWGHTDTYKFKRTNKGWEIRNFVNTGNCNKKGEPSLYDYFDHDSINYPEELPGYLEWLWDQAKEKGLSQQEVQEALNELASWINLCERNSPKGVWFGYK